MKRLQHLESAKSWLESYEGNKIVRDYRRWYGVSWEVAFVELEMLDVPIDPEYKERVLQTAAAQVAAKRQKRSRLRAQRADVWSEYEDDETALERAGECNGCDASTSSAQVMFRPLDDLGLCPICAAMLERDTSTSSVQGLSGSEIGNTRPLPSCCLMRRGKIYVARLWPNMVRVWS